MSNILKRSPIEYKVLGRGTVEVHGRHLSIDEHLRSGSPTVVESILNTLGEDGWDPVKLEYPYIFKRSISKMEVEIDRLAYELVKQEQGAS
jgi:hypothetical protein